MSRERKHLRLERSPDYVPVVKCRTIAGMGEQAT
jgi:hypothetical protein